MFTQEVDPEEVDVDHVDDRFMEIRAWPDTPAQWIPVAQARNPLMHLYADLWPAPKGMVGQLVGEDTHAPPVWLEAAGGVSGYLAALLQGLESGDVVVHQNPDSGFLSWADRRGRPFMAPGYSRSVADRRPTGLATERAAEWSLSRC
jgi:hypothetical protein